MPTGQLLSVQAVCLGWHWYPYVYSRFAEDTDGAPVKPLPPEIVALARTLGDELIVADCDLDAVTWGRETYFRFDVNRRIEHYGLIASQRGVIPPE